MNLVLLRTELRRAARNRRTLMFAAVLPAVFFLAFSTTQGGGGKLDSLAVAPYVMVSMATYGAMNALFTAGGVIAAERAVGWNRQLRVAGLPSRDYVLAKAVMGYLTAVPGVLLILALGATVRHVSLPAAQWVEAAVAVLAALAPIAALGVAIGYVARPQALQAVFGIGSALLALLGGLWLPVNSFPAAVRGIIEALPTYWAAQAGRSVLTGSWMGWRGVAVIGAWTVVLSVVAGWAYRRDALRPAVAGTT